jgi:hypothetical protein
MWRKQKINQKEEQFVRSKFFGGPVALFFLMLSWCANATHDFTYNDHIVLAQKYNYELQLNKASAILRSELAQDTDNSSIHFVLHFNAFVRAFVSEEPADYKVYLSVQNTAIEHIEKLSDQNPYKNFALAEIYFYSAALKGKLDELYGAARDINRAHSLIEENHKRFPNFLPNNKTRGILKVYLATVPENYAWIINLLGIKGDLQEGLHLLKILAHQDGNIMEYQGVAKEAAYLYSFALYHVAKQSNTAWAETMRCTEDYKTSLASAFFRSNMALKLNKNDVAIQILSTRPVGQDYEQSPIFYYLLGTAKLNKQDPTSIHDFVSFKTTYKGKNYVKSNLQKMSWYYLLAGNTAQAEVYKSMIPKVGASINEEDKLAIQYSKKSLPNKQLLHTRLLYDGGYYKEALGVISKVVIKELPNNNQKAEYCYRRGRISEKLGDVAVAMKYYEASSLYALQSDEYYGAYASIYLGEYYAKKGDKTNAKKYFNRALGFKNNKEYVASVEQRAKSGLKKLN